MGHFALRHGLERKPVLGLRAVEGGYTWHGLSRPWMGKLQVPFFFFFFQLLLLKVLVCVLFLFGGA